MALPTRHHYGVGGESSGIVITRINLIDKSGMMDHLNVNDSSLLSETASVFNQSCSFMMSSVSPEELTFMADSSSSV